LGADNIQRPLMSFCGCGAGGAGPSALAQAATMTANTMPPALRHPPTSIFLRMIFPENRFPLFRDHARAHFIVGITNSAPFLMPDGQREVTVLVLV
jgi:hypothetical protein